MNTPPCSEHRLVSLLVVEGTPGAGKTTLITALATRGLRTVGEYVTPTGATLAWADHPGVDEDQAHQQNWTAKHDLAHDPGSGRVVACDRDWVSALAYAASLDDTPLLGARARWADAALTQGQLCVAENYLVLHLDPDTSLTRRSGRLTPGHPWSTRPGLRRLEQFYADPAAAVARAHPRLGERLAGARWLHLHAPNPQQALEAALGLCAATP